jgi:hypothetical protein
MTSRERLSAAMKLKEVDKVPLAPRIHHQVRRYFNTNEPWGYLKFQEKFDMDINVNYLYPCTNPVFDCLDKLDYVNGCDISIKYDDRDDHQLVTRIFETPAGRLQDVTMFPKPNQAMSNYATFPHKVEFLIKGPDDVDKLRYLVPDFSKTNFSDYNFYDELIGERGMLMMTSYGPMDYWGGEAISMEEIMMMYYEDPAGFDKIINFFGDLTYGMLESAVNAGIKNFFLCNFYPSLSSGWSPEIIRTKFAPWIKKQVDLIHSVGGLTDFYDDGKLMSSIEIFKNCGVDCIGTCAPAPVGDFDLKAAREKFRHDICFKGVCDMINIVCNGTPEMIDRDIKRILAENGGKKALILGTMDGFRPETSDENIAAYFASANKYR